MSNHRTGADWLNTTEGLARYPQLAEIRRVAALVCSNAHDATEARMFLDMLGLITPLVSR